MGKYHVMPSNYKRRQEVKHNKEEIAKKNGLFLQQSILLINSSTP